MGAAESELQVAAFSVPRPYSYAVACGKVRTVDLVGVETFPCPADGLLLVLHANPSWDEDLAARLRAGGLAVPAEPHVPQGLVCLGLVRTLVFPHEGGTWFAELEDVVGIEPAHKTKGWRGLYELPGNLAAVLAEGWEKKVKEAADAAAEEAGDPTPEP